MADPASLSDESSFLPGEASARAGDDSGLIYEAEETEATRIDLEEGDEQDAPQGGKFMPALTLLGIAVAAVLGGRLLWSHINTKLALAALKEQGAIITQQTGQVRITAVNDRFQDEDLMLIGRISCPIQLTLTDNPQITDKGIAHLVGMTNITGLDLGGTSITDAGMVHLATLTNLERLDVSYNPALTDEGLKHVQGLEHLKELTLSETSVSDHGISELHSLEKLEFLVVGSTKVTDAGARKIKQALPELIVFH